MKRIAFIVVMALMSITASATSIRYFTYPQASRTVQYLNMQQEMMIYCGYDYEIETYVLINEVWMERVNSAYYELWVYGYDAYTGDEIYMPLDLQCVWLYSAGRIYNAAQYLRFHATVHTPMFHWYIPPYNPYTRRMHSAGYVRSYHYDVHRHGWMPPMPPAHGWGPHAQPPLPPYYMRTPQTPAPVHTGHWTPGLDRPQVNNSGTQSGPRTTGAVPTTRPSSGTTQGTTPSTRSGNVRRGNAGGNTETRGTETRGTETRGTETRGTTTRGTETRGTETRGTTTRSTETRGTETRGTTTRSTETRGTETRGTEVRSSGSTTRTTGTTPTRKNTGTTRTTENSNAAPAAPATRTGTSRGAAATATSTTDRTNRTATSSGRSTGTRR